MALSVIDPVAAISLSKTRKDVIVQMIRDNILRPGIDYGIIPGTGKAGEEKKTLFKPGAERLCSAFRFCPEFEKMDSITRWDDQEPLFYFEYRCRLIHIDSGLQIATGVGSCNSREDRYRWRWVDESKVPAWLDKSKLETRGGALKEAEWKINKGETSGPYGKKPEYWQAFRDAIQSKTARESFQANKRGEQERVWEIVSVQYRIPNDDIFSLVNTIDKMACKRALIAATLIGANASEFFTQDVEDLHRQGFGVVIQYDNEDEGNGNVPPPDMTITGEFSDQPKSNVITMDTPLNARPEDKGAWTDKPAQPKASNPPPAPTPEPKWHQDAAKIVILETKLIQDGIPQSEIAGLVGQKGGVTDWAQFETGAIAYKAIMQRFADRQPAAKPVKQDGMDWIPAATDFLHDKFGLTFDVFDDPDTKLPALDTITSMDAFMSAFMPVAVREALAMKATKVAYGKVGSRNALKFNTHMETVHYSRTEIVKMLRENDVLDQDQCDAIQNMQPGDEIEFPEPLMIEWKGTNSGVRTVENIELSF